MNVANCPKCGKLYVKNIKDVCPNCVKEIEEMFDRCVKYIKENRRCNISDLSEGAEVPVGQITKFIREGRISIATLPNMGFPCDVCGADIREGTICDSCRQRLSKDVNNLSEDERKREQLRQQLQNKTSYNIRDTDRR